MKFIIYVFSIVISVSSAYAGGCGPIEFTSSVRKCTTNKQVRVRLERHEPPSADALPIPDEYCEIKAGQPIGVRDCHGECRYFCEQYFWVCRVEFAGQRTGIFDVARMDPDPLNPHFDQSPSISNCRR